VAYERLLFIDECLSKAIARELRGRGRNAKSASQLGLLSVKDPKLLPRLVQMFKDEDWVLVTGDDNMPLEHAAAIQEGKITVATLDGRIPAGFRAEDWKREIVHRWAHVMCEQADTTVRRYSVSWHRRWTPRAKR
jgi:predicted nuclease of predicted toxin-antitoxin system